MSHPLIQVARLALDTPAYRYQGVRKILNGVTWEIPEGINHQLIRFSHLGYGANKLSQLKRNYVNEEEFARVRAVLDRRRDQSFTSVACSMRGASKGNRSMGHCILSIVITRAKSCEERVEVQYRSTELTLKFGGDLAFLPWVFDQLGLNPDSPVTFRFANCFLSGVYLPYLVTFADPIEILNDILESDLEFFKHATRFFLRSSMEEAQFFPYSPENVAHRFGWSHIDEPTMRNIRTWLAKQHKKFGPLDWAKVHHQKGDYIPRGQRAAAREIAGEDED